MSDDHKRTKEKAVLQNAPAGHVRTDADEFFELAEQSMERAAKIQEFLEGRELTREEIEYERRLCRAFRNQASINLHQHGLRIQKWEQDGRGLGYVIVARDRLNRRFEILFRYGDIERPEQFERSAEGIGRDVIAHVCKILIEEKERYMRRLQSCH